MKFSLKKKTNELIQLISVAEVGNGYIRFSNGFQICYDLILDIVNHRGSTITFQKPFITTPVLTVSRFLADLGYTTNLNAEIHYASIKNDSFVIIGIDEVDSANVINFSYIAIGRWK